jgi:YHS domain-containing protein
MKKTLLGLVIALGLSAPMGLAKTASYPLKTCVVTQDELGDAPVSVEYQGRTIPLCCKACVRKFKANPEKYAAIFDKGMAKKKK